MDHRGFRGWRRGRVLIGMGSAKVDRADSSKADLQAALERSNQQLAVLAALQNSYDGPSFSVDRNYCYTSFNKAHAATMNALYGVEIALGVSLLDCQTVPEDRRISKRNLDRALAGEAFLEEAPSGDDLRSRRFFEVAHSPIHAEDGTIAGAAVFVRNISKLRRAEDGLQEALLESRYLREALDRVSAFIYLKDSQSRYLYGNRPTLDLFGCPAKDLKGAEDSQFFPPATVARLRAIDLRVLGGEETAEEVRVPEASGGSRTYWEIKTPIYSDDERKTIWGLLGISTDISITKRTEEALRVSEARLSTMLQTTRDGVCLLGPNGRFEDMNTTACEMLGFTREEMLCLTLEGLEANGTNPWAFGSALGARQKHRELIETALWRKDGTFLPVEIALSDLPDTMQVVAFIRDISVRRLNEERLRSALELLRHSENLAKVGGWEMALANREINWSEGLFRIFELDPEGACPSLESSLTFFAPDSRLPFLNAIEEAIATGREFDLEFDLITSKGKQLRAQAVSEVLHLDGRAAKLLVAFQDISERARLEADLKLFNQELEDRVRERTRQLENANQELEAFAFSVSHDLRAPARAMSGFAGVLIQRQPTGLEDVDLHYLRRIYEASLKMNQLIDDLLRLSHIGRDERVILPIDLALLAGEAFKQCQELEPSRMVKLKVQGPIPVRGDPRIIRVLMETLVGNAWKFTVSQPEAVIEVGFDPGKPEVIFIRDNGVGFLMAHVGRLFLPFQRLHTASEFGGTGIGLAVAKRIVGLHGGRIWAQGEPGLGATFYFTLPLFTKGDAKLAPSSRTPPPIPQEGR